MDGSPPISAMGSFASEAKGLRIRKAIGKREGRRLKMLTDSLAMSAASGTEQREGLYQ